MKSHLSLAILFLVIEGLLLGVSAPASAQEFPHPLVVKAESLMVDFRRTQTEYNELKDRLGTLSGEDSIIVRRQMFEMILGAFDDIEELTDVAVKQRDQGLDNSELRNHIAELLRPVPDGLAAAIENTYSMQTTLRSEATSTSPEDLAELQENIDALDQRVDELNEMALRHLIVNERLEFDVDDLRQQLIARLDQRAQLTAGRVRLALEERDRFQKQADQYPDDASRQREADAAQLEVDHSVESLEEVTGEIARGLTDAKVAMSLIQKWLTQARDWTTNNGPRVIIKIILFLVIVFAFRILGKVISRAVVRGIDSSKFSPSQLLRNMIASATGNLVMLFGILVALSQIGVSLGPLLAGLGVVGFIVGFALQETLSNFAAGMMILFYRPFDVGDTVEAAGVKGKVSDMSLVSTTILTFDNQTLIVPNGKIWGDVIRNVTAQENRRVDMVFGISYTDDIPKAESILESILDQHDKVLDDPERTVKVHELGDSSVNFVVRPWVLTDDYWDVYWDITREVKMRFDKEGVSIPFPQRDVHLYRQTESVVGVGGEAPPA
jgi:small conductance mechanosensitive channel